MCKKMCCSSINISPLQIHIILCSYASCLYFVIVATIFLGNDIADTELNANNMFYFAALGQDL